jgi:hypothetical protein
MVGIFFGWRGRADENWLDVFGPDQERLRMEAHE